MGGAGGDGGGDGGVGGCICLSHPVPRQSLLLTDIRVKSSPSRERARYSLDASGTRTAPPQTSTGTDTSVPPGSPTTPEAVAGSPFHMLFASQTPVEYWSFHHTSSPATKVTSKSGTPRRVSCISDPGGFCERARQGRGGKHRAKQQHVGMGVRPQGVRCAGSQT